MIQEDIEYVRQCIKKDIHKFYTWEKWKIKRKEILAMDHFECQDCKASGKYTKATTVHHNQFVIYHPELALETWYEFGGRRYRNLISLCHDCHEKRHGYRKPEVMAPLTEERWD